VPAPLAGLTLSNLEDIAAFGNFVILVGTSDGQGLVAISRDNGLSFDAQVGVGGMTTASTVVILDESHAYVGGYFAPGGVIENATAVLLYTSDGGSTWQDISVPDGTIQIVDLFFHAPDAGYAIINAIQRITALPDGSLTWGEPEPLVPTPTFGGVSRLFGSTEGTVFAVGSGGLYKTKP
jgi:hypothetical protein